MDQIRALQDWYLARFDGDWEHRFGVEIGTLDNPGWFLKIDLERTGLDNREFSEIKDLEHESDWVHCRVSDSLWEGFGGPKKLGTLISVFLDWAGGRSGAGQAV